jgi:hypothetical protein
MGYFDFGMTQQRRQLSTSCEALLVKEERLIGNINFPPH